MAKLKEIVEKVRSKNAGPFWVTIDIFCGAAQPYRRVSRKLATKRVAGVFQTDEKSVNRFDIANLNVIKFSLKRPQIQGSLTDRDMHGAAWATLIGELEIAD